MTIGWSTSVATPQDFTLVICTLRSSRTSPDEDRMSYTNSPILHAHHTRKQGLPEGCTDGVWTKILCHWIDTELVAVRLEVVSLSTGYSNTQSTCMLGPFTGKKVSTYNLVRTFPGLFTRGIRQLSRWRLWQTSSLFPALLCIPGLCLQLVFLINQGKWQSSVHRELCSQRALPHRGDTPACWWCALQRCPESQGHKNQALMFPTPLLKGKLCWNAPLTQDKVTLLQRALRCMH